MTAGWRGYGAVAYMAVVSTIAVYGVWYYLMGRYPMSQMMPYTLVAPLVGILGGIILLSEELTWMIALGIAVTLIGVVVIVFASMRTGKVGESIAVEPGQKERP